MDLSILNALPPLKNVDFNDPLNKKKALVVILAIIAFIIASIVILLPNDDNQTVSTETTSQIEAPVLEVQDGEDMDQLSGKDNISIFRSGSGQSLAEKLFEPKDTVFTDNPLGNIGVPSPNTETSTDSNSQGAATTSSNSIRPGQEGVYSSLTSQPLQPISMDDIKAALNANDNNRENNKEKEKIEKEQRARERAQQERERLIAIGINPDTNQPLDESPLMANQPSKTSTGGKSSTSAPVTQQQPQTTGQTPEVVISEKELIDDDNSFGLGTTRISSIESARRKDMDKLTVKAMFIEEKKVKSGERIQLLLCEDKGITVEGLHIPKNTLLYASVSISDRLYINVQSINVNGRILPLSLEAYDIDGLRGIYCPANEAEQMLKQAGQEAKTLASGVVSGMMNMFGARFVNYGNTVTDRVTGQTAVYITPGYSFDLMKTQQ